ncbi:imidazole glycerol phosphate synthase subunit HisH [Leptospira noguchii]|nr:imidazole glycerol phosphate synthase subunit HisH [Leptospira noguchii]
MKNISSNQKIVIVDYGMGNLRSVKMKFERMKYDSVISSDPEIIKNASHLILPGVGHFAEGMKNIFERGLKESLDHAVIQRKVPILGICLGMQLLTRFSEEGNVNGLGWIDALTRKFDFNSSPNGVKYRIPHVGWNSIKIRRDSVLLEGIQNLSRFYFTHSYAVQCEVETESIAETEYGYSFSSIVQKDNIYGTQFHPEKSHQIGLKLIENFIRKL